VLWASSAYSINAGGKQVVVPYSGSVSADPESSDVMRLDVLGEPGTLPIGVSETIDYGRVHLGAVDFLVPLFVVELEFSTLSFGDTHASCSARLVGPTLRYERRPNSVDPRALYNPPPPLIDVKGLEIDASDPSSPLGMIRVRTGKLNLVPGLRIILETEGE
jgi:hypothetical protein